MDRQELTFQAEAGNAEAQANLAECGFISKDYESAWKWANLSAAQECPHGLYTLGMCYVHGFNTAPDIEKAQQLFEKSESLGCTRAILGKVAVLEKEEGEHFPSLKAMSLINNAAKENDAKGLFLLALAYRDGIKVVRCPNRALDLLLQSAQQEYVPAVYELAEIYLSNESGLFDAEKGIELLKKAANQGFADAEMRLGQLTIMGEYVDRDDEKAIKLIESAVSKDCAEAILLLGICYFHGEGVAQDKEKALEYFNRAAEKGANGSNYFIELATEGKDKVNEKLAKAKQEEIEYRDKVEAGAREGNADDLYTIAVFYYEGVVRQYVEYEQNFAKAEEYYRKAAEKGDTDAMFELGLLCKYGAGERKPDLQEAMHWFEAAANLGDTEAMVELANCLQGQQLLDNAAVWIEKALAADEPTAFGVLSIQCLYAPDVPGNKDKAYEFARKAVEANDSEGEYALGLCYLYGVGVDIDFETGIEWLTLASNHTNVNAMIYLARLLMGECGSPLFDLELSDTLFRRAMACGSATATYELGRLIWMYATDRSEAFKLFELAAERGNAQAANALKELNHDSD